MNNELMGNSLYRQCTSIMFRHSEALSHSFNVLRKRRKSSCGRLFHTVIKKSKNSYFWLREGLIFKVHLQSRGRIKCICWQRQSSQRCHPQGPILHHNKLGLFISFFSGAEGNSWEDVMSVQREGHVSCCQLCLAH